MLCICDLEVLEKHLHFFQNPNNFLVIKCHLHNHGVEGSMVALVRPMDVVLDKYDYANCKNCS